MPSILEFEDAEPALSITHPVSQLEIRRKDRGT